MTFFDKFSLLTQRRGLSPRAVALTVGFDPSAIAQWKRRGSRPNPATASQLAFYFGVSVEDLLDDSRDLSPVVTAEPVTTLLNEDQPEYRLATNPIKLAAALAQRQHGPDQAAGQAGFAKHLANLRSMRTEAERLHPTDPAAAAVQLDTLLASYIAALDTHP